MADINVLTETDTSRGWSFTVDVTDNDQTYHFSVTLNWSDYDHWSRGQVSPEKVIIAAFRFLLQREPVRAILKSFDCAIIRRYFSDVDTALPLLF